MHFEGPLYYTVKSIMLLASSMQLQYFLSLHFFFFEVIRFWPTNSHGKFHLTSVNLATAEMSTVIFTKF